MEEQVHNSKHKANNVEEQQSIVEDNKMDIVVNKEESNKKVLTSEYVFDKNYFFNRSFHGSEDGNYNEEGFFYTPEGSFWDDEKEYFNRFGFDKYGGKYNTEGIYIPGEGWDEDLQCYQEDVNKDLMEKNQDDIEGIIEARIQMMNNNLDDSVLSENLEEELFNEVKEKKTDFLNIKQIIKEEIEEFSQKSGLNVNVEQAVKEIAPLYHDNHEILENKQNDFEEEKDKNHSEKRNSKNNINQNDDKCEIQEQTPESQIANAIKQSQKEIDNIKIISASKIINNNIIITSDAKANTSKIFEEEKYQKTNDKKENNFNVMVVDKPITPSKSQVTSKTPMKSGFKSISKANNI